MEQDETLRALETSSLFDASWYQGMHPEIIGTNHSPESHYLKEGWKKGYNPSVHFNTNYYLDSYPDVRKANINPLVHFIMHGEKEKRRPYAQYNEKLLHEQLGISTIESFIQFLTDSRENLNKVYNFLSLDARELFFGCTSCNKILILTRVPADDGVYIWRVAFLKEYLEQRGFEVVIETLNLPTADFYINLWSARIVIFNRPIMSPSHVSLITETKRLGKKLVIDIDDLYMDSLAYCSGPVRTGMVPLSTVQRNMQKTMQVLASGDALTVSTIYLKECFQKLFNRDVVVYNNRISQDFIQQKYKKRKGKGFSVLLASGSPTHDYDLSTIYVDLVNFIIRHPDATLSIMGDFRASFCMIESQVRRIPRKPFSDMIAEFAKHDLLVAPLENNHFNNAKSNIKFIEAACAGTPLLVKNCREFIPLAETYSVYLYDDDFYEKLEYIYTHRGEAEDVAKRALNLVMESYSSTAPAPEYDTLIDKLYNS